MSEKNTGGPAFPCIDSQWNNAEQKWGMPASQGMTLRDYFAAKYIAGCAADPATQWGGENAVHHAATAYKVADAMLKAREA